MNRIAELRKRKGWTQQDLAVRAGLHTQTVSEAERGYRGNPAEETLQALAHALGTSVDDLTEPSPDPSPTSKVAG